MQGAIHRDLEPSNIVIRESGAKREPGIVGFGLARQSDSQEKKSDQNQPDDRHRCLYAAVAH